MLIKMVGKKFKCEPLVSFFLRSGLAVVFFYAGIASLLTPENWIGFVPDFVRSIFPASIFLALFSIYQIILGIWLLSNKKIFYASILSVLTMFFIVITNIFLFDILFRDIAILLMAIALAIFSHKEK